MPVELLREAHATTYRGMIGATNGEINPRGPTPRVELASALADSTIQRVQQGHEILFGVLRYLDKLLHVLGLACSYLANQLLAYRPYLCFRPKLGKTLLGRLVDRSALRTLRGSLRSHVPVPDQLLDCISRSAT
jgi:hypothetical protein